MAEEDSVKELQRKRHSATPGVSFKGRVRKAARWQAASDRESDEESESNVFLNYTGTGTVHLYILSPLDIPFLPLIYTSIFP